MSTFTPTNASFHSVLYCWKNNNPDFKSDACSIDEMQNIANHLINLDRCCVMSKKEKKTASPQLIDICHQLDGDIATLDYVIKTTFRKTSDAAAMRDSCGLIGYTKSTPPKRKFILPTSENERNTLFEKVIAAIANLDPSLFENFKFIWPRWRAQQQAHAVAMAAIHTNTAKNIHLLAKDALQRLYDQLHQKFYSNPTQFNQILIQFGYKN